MKVLVLGSKQMTFCAPRQPHTTYLIENFQTMAN